MAACQLIWPAVWMQHLSIKKFSHIFTSNQPHHTGHITRIEALTRWQIPKYGPIPPLEFLDTIAGSGRLNISQTQSHTACSPRCATSKIRAWMSPGVAANSARQDLEHPQMVTRIIWALDQFDLKADRQSIEVLESVVVHKSDTKVHHAIDQLAKLGCTIDLDDFGIVQITIQFAVPVQG